MRIPVALLVASLVISTVLVVAPGVQATQESWYTYAGQHVIQESQPIGSVLPQGVAPTAPNVHVIRQWVYGPQVDEVLAMDVDAGQDGQGAIGAGDARYWYAYDSGANVLGLIDETGHMVEGYAYGAYGDVTIFVPSSGREDVLWDGVDAVSTGVYGNDPTPHPYSPSGNLWYFTGRQYDPEIGSYHYRARQYHPTLGQFMSRDPIGAWGDAASLGNPYAYVGNNPGSVRDPSGLCPMCIGALVGAAAGALLETGLYSYEVASSGGGWDHQVARERIRFGLIAGAGIGATGGLGASVVGSVAAGGASAGTVFAATLGVGAVEGVAGQAIVELASTGELSGDVQAYAEQAVIGAVTAGIGYGVGKFWTNARPRPTPAPNWVDDTVPPDRGFAHEPIDHVLQPGETISRFGRETGTYASPVGTPFEARSLPESARSRPEAIYEILQPLQVKTGLSLPWYGQPGLGIQHELPHSIRVLMDKGILRRL